MKGKEPIVHKLAEINPNFKKIQFRSTKYTPYIYA